MSLILIIDTFCYFVILSVGMPIEREGRGEEGGIPSVTWFFQKAWNRDFSEIGLIFRFQSGLHHL